MKEIKEHQLSTKLLLPAAPFRRLVDEITFDLTNRDISYKQSAVKALQTGVEDYTVRLLRKANTVAHYRGRDTILSEDISLVQQLQNDTA